jgi:hypothetical protein
MRKLIALLMLAPAAHAANYRQIVQRVADMVDDPNAQQLLERYKLQLLNVMWEDTGRWEGSSVGPNISDVTIEVEDHGRTTLMPVIRYPNFSDLSGDVKMDSIMIPVGNHTSQGQLESISLSEFLKDPTRYMSLPQKGKIRGNSLFAKRDSHALVSAQTAFLPVPHEGKATFWPVIFNYQSYKKNPAVLAILVTRQGTSMTIVDNARDSVGGDWGQRLFFNDRGQRAPLIAERLGDVKEHGETANHEDAQSLGEDANLLMLIQVPLKQRPRPHRAFYGDGDDMKMLQPSFGAEGGMAKPKEEERRRDVEVAVLGHGPQLGPYTELDGLTIERDPRFPVRVTIQFYQATTTGHLAAADARAFSQQIRKVYKQADYLGSLVVPTAADKRRPTRWTGAGVAPAAISWMQFMGLYERFSGLSFP